MAQHDMSGDIPKQPESTDPLTNIDLSSRTFHSGQLGLEFPVTEFYNTSLHQATSEGLIRTPEHLGDLTETIDLGYSDDQLPPELTAESPSSIKTGFKDNDHGIGKYIAGAAIFAGGAVFALITNHSGSDKLPKDEVAVAVTIPTTTTTTAPFGPKNYNFHDGQEGQPANFKFVPEYALTDDPQEVLGTLGGNLSKLYSELNPDYMKFYVADVTSPLAQRITDRLRLLKNYYDIKETFQYVSDRHDGDSWYITADWIEDTEGKVFSEKVRLQLVKKEFIENTESTTEGAKFIYAWVVVESVRIPS